MKKILYLMVLVVMVSTALAAVDVSVEGVDRDAQTIDIYMTSDEPLRGFQFDLEGVTLAAGVGSGGSAAAASFLVQLEPANGRLVGISLAGQDLAVGEDLLTRVSYSELTGDEICILNPVFSTPASQAAQVTVGECFNLNEVQCIDNDNDGYDTCAIGDEGDDGNALDCDDDMAIMSPGEEEVCGDGFDNNCNAQVDEGCAGGCEEDWTCGEYGDCVNGEQIRACLDQNACGTEVNKPALAGVCEAGAVCGNGVVDDGEDCDSNAPIDLFCEDHDSDLYTAGSVFCTDECTYQVDECEEHMCGDNILGPNEQCEIGTEGCDHNTCLALAGWSCNAGVCAEVVEAVCGNGIVEEGEGCDADMAYCHQNTCEVSAHWVCEEGYEGDGEAQSCSLNLQGNLHDIEQNLVLLGNHDQLQNNYWVVGRLFYCGVFFPDGGEVCDSLVQENVEAEMRDDEETHLVERLMVMMVDVRTSSLEKMGELAAEYKHYLFVEAQE